MTNNLSWVSWVHTPRVELVHLSSEGRIRFLDPRSGRVKAFPNQGSQGNFSICIDELEDSDLGCYRCNHRGACLQVELVKGECVSDSQFECFNAASSSSMVTNPVDRIHESGQVNELELPVKIHLCLTTTYCAETQREEMWLLIYICAGVAAFVLLSFCSYCKFLPSICPVHSVCL